MEKTDLGTLARQGDRWTLTFTRKLAHPREKVWRAVTRGFYHRPALRLGGTRRQPGLIGISTYRAYRLPWHPDA